jgi:hypothetical protein
MIKKIAIQKIRTKLDIKKQIKEHLYILTRKT